MKKILVIIVLSIVLISNIKLDRTSIKKEETRAIFVSYIELNKYIKGNDYEISKRNIRKIIKNIKRLKCNTIILQVRSASDAIYKSTIYPMSLNIVNTEYDDYYDVLDYFIKESHKSNVKVIAWINPYRIRTTCDKTTITEKNPAYKYLDTDIVYINNGIYYNPSKQETEDLIVKGVEEVLNYDVDGILFDDYFYPDNNIDKKDYEEYIKNNEFIEEKNYRLNIVNKMIKRVYKTCKNKNIKFGISPDGNIDNNYNKNYADVKSWLKSNEYIDFIMPQIYYGFYNSTRDYIKVTKEAESLMKQKYDFPNCISTFQSQIPPYGKWYEVKGGWYESFEKQYEEDKREELVSKCYAAYQLDWMISHEYGLYDIVQALNDEFHKSEKDGYENPTPGELFQEFEDTGFHSEIYACKDEFLDCEFQDEAYMNHLFAMMPDSDSIRNFYKELMEEPTQEREEER